MLTEAESPPGGVFLLPGEGIGDGLALERAIRRRVRLLALRGLLGGEAGQLTNTERASLRQIQARLEEIARSKPESLLEVLGDPLFETPLLCLLSRRVAAEGVWRTVLPTLLAWLAEGGLIDRPLLWEGSATGLVLAGGTERLAFGTGTRGLLAEKGGFSVRLVGGGSLAWPADALPVGVTVETCAWGMAPGLWLSAADTNPLSDFEAHPDKSGNAVSLGGRTPAVWLEAFEAAVELVRKGLPGFAPCLGGTLKRVVPVGYEPERHLSATYREGPGQAYLTLHPNPLTLSEALIHEAQHGRLGAAQLVDPLLENAFTEWTPSPVRPDLRPINGILLAVHAFIPVAVLHAVLAERGEPKAAGPDFERRRAQVLRGNEAGMAILREKAVATPLGKRVIADLERLHAWTLRQPGASVQGDRDQLPC